MVIFRYRRYLEAQIEELKAEKLQLQEKNDELIKALVPILRKMSEPKGNLTAAEMAGVSKVHDIKKTTNGATCPCGWNTYNSDPAQVQEQINAHYRETTQAVRGGRKSWPQMKAVLESTGD